MSAAMVMNVRDRLTPRVLRRHLRAVSEDEPEVVLTTRSDSVSVIYSDGGVITRDDVCRLLRPRLGALRGLTFLSPREGPNVVRWFGVTEAGVMVGGKLVLHAGMRGDQIVSWAQIVVDPVPKQARTASTGSRARLEDIAARVREIIHRVREQPTYGPPELIAALVGVVDIAEGDAADQG